MVRRLLVLVTVLASALPLACDGSADESKDAKGTKDTKDAKAKAKGDGADDEKAKADSPAGAEAAPPKDAKGCDPFASNCDAKGDTPKCAFDAPTKQLTCSPSLGTKAAGEECERPTGVAGSDTCGPGLYCSFWGLAKSVPQKRVCQRMCDAAHGCGDGEVCTALTMGGTVGACAPGCEPFAEPSGCPQGTTCGLLNGLGTPMTWGCQFDGTVGEGEACNEEVDCAAGLSCLRPMLGAGTCRKICDDAHPCEREGDTCRTMPSMDEGACAPKGA